MQSSRFFQQNKVTWKRKRFVQYQQQKASATKHAAIPEPATNTDGSGDDKSFVVNNDDETAIDDEDEDDAAGEKKKASIEDKLSGSDNSLSTFTRGVRKTNKVVADHHGCHKS